MPAGGTGRNRQLHRVETFALRYGLTLVALALVVLALIAMALVVALVVLMLIVLARAARRAACAVALPAVGEQQIS
jgi:hypothetical protein